MTNEDIEIFLKTFSIETRGHCFYCGGPILAPPFGKGPRNMKGTWVAVPFVPLSKGGQNTISNLVPSCWHCADKGKDKMPWDFMPSKFRKGDTEPDSYAVLFRADTPRAKALEELQRMARTG